MWFGYPYDQAGLKTKYNLTDEQFTRLYEGSIVHEKPLTNALGPNYRDILTKENVIARFKKL